MQCVYEEVKTPSKYGVILRPENEDRLLDCPSVFRFVVSLLRFVASGPLFGEFNHRNRDVGLGETHAAAPAEGHAVGA